MKINENIAKIKNNIIGLFGKNKKLFIAVLLAILGVIVILFLPTSQKQYSSNEVNENIDLTSQKNYSERLENKISKMLTRLSCITFADVLVITDMSEKYVYLMQTETIKNGESETTKEEVVYDKNGSSQQPIKVQTIYPKVTGVMITINRVDASTKISIQNAVAGVLNIDTACIFILQEK